LWGGRLYTDYINNAKGNDKMMNSVYADNAESLLALGFDCTLLTDQQMDTVGMAAENAELDWDWATANSNNDEDRISRITEAKDAVEACGAETENEMIALHVGILFDDFGIQR
jgi:hypothetical protein